MLGSLDNFEFVLLSTVKMHNVKIAFERAYIQILKFC